MHAERHPVVAHPPAENALARRLLAGLEDRPRRRFARAGAQALAGRQVEAAIAVRRVGRGMADDAGRSLAEGVRRAHQRGDVIVGDGNVALQDQCFDRRVIAFQLDLALAQVLQPAVIEC
jgi:hypothetical protein